MILEKSYLALLTEPRPRYSPLLTAANALEAITQVLA